MVVVQIALTVLLIGWPADWSPEGKTVKVEKFSTFVIAGEPVILRTAAYSDNVVVSYLQYRGSYERAVLIMDSLECGPVLWDVGVFDPATTKARPIDEWGPADWRRTANTLPECRRAHEATWPTTNRLRSVSSDHLAREDPG